MQVELRLARHSWVRRGRWSAWTRPPAGADQRRVSRTRFIEGSCCDVRCRSRRPTSHFPRDVLGMSQGRSRDAGDGHDFFEDASRVPNRNFACGEVLRRHCRRQPWPGPPPRGRVDGSHKSRWGRRALRTLPRSRIRGRRLVPMVAHAAALTPSDSHLASAGSFRSLRVI